MSDPFEYILIDEADLTELNEAFSSVAPWLDQIQPVLAPAKDSPPACECGAFRASGTKRGEIGHSSWCPWAAA